MCTFVLQKTVQTKTVVFAVCCIQKRWAFYSLCMCKFALPPLWIGIMYFTLQQQQHPSKDKRYCLMRRAGGRWEKRGLDLVHVVHREGEEK